MKKDDTITMDGVTFEMKELPTKLQYYVAQIKDLNAKEIIATMELDTIKTAKNTYIQELSKQLTAIVDARNVAADEKVSETV